MERDELLGELWLLQRGAFELFGCKRRGREKRIRRGFAKRPRTAVAGIRRDFFPFQRTQLLQPVEQSGRERAIIMLDLAEVGNGYAEPAREIGLLGSPRDAEFAELCSSKNALPCHRNGLHCDGCRAAAGV